MKRHLLALVLLSACAAFGGFVIHNEDCTEYYCHPDFPATEAGARSWLARYLDAGSDSLKIMMLNPQGQTASYPSKVLRPGWAGLERNAEGLLTYHGKPLSKAETSMFDRMRTLFDGGTDVYAVWIAQCREAGVSPWISVRMNDVHDAHLADWHMHSELWKARHDFWLNEYSGGSWMPRQLDYARPEVRQLYMDVVAELLERYDGDGLELDFMRFGNVFRYGHEIDDAHYLTEFVREVRRRCDEKAKAAGHKVGLAVRVPADPRDAYGRGFDVEAWLDEGLVDIVTRTVFCTTNWDDVPIHIWKRIVRGRATLAACVEACNKPYASFPKAVYGAPFDYALANLYYARGADAIYTFNHFGPSKDHYPRLANPELTAAQIRRTMLSYSDTRCLGGEWHPLPTTLSEGQTRVRLNIGTLPEAGRAAQIIIGARTPFPDGKLPVVRLNGTLN